jgi:hypothetical protein
VRRLSLRDHLDEVITDAGLRDHVEQVTAPPPEQPVAPDAAAIPPAPPFAASLTGAVTPLSEARQPQPQPPTTPAPIESPPGRSIQTFTYGKPATADNAPAVDTVAAGAPLPEGPPAPHLARRRRRSASPLPPLPSPIDIPEDAPGRVTFIALPGAPDVVPPAGPLAETPAPAPPLARPSFASPLDEWLPVVLFGVAMLVVFIVGVVVTH